MKVKALEHNIPEIISSSGNNSDYNNYSVR